MTSFGDDLYCKEITAHTINWKDFNPPLESEGISTLASVLEAGNDANNEEIVNVGKIVMAADAGNLLNDASITGASTVSAQTVTSTFVTALEATVGDDLALGTSGASGGTITFNAGASAGACSITGPAVTNRCVVTNCDFTSASNTFPSSIDDDTIEDVLARGSDANSENLSNVNVFSATTVSVLASGSLLASGASTCQLPGTQMYGSINMEDASNTKHSLTNASAIQGATITATGTTGFEGQIAATRQVTVPVLQITVPYSGQPVDSGIEFNSGITTETSIRGVSTANRTKLLNCDLSSTTNLQASPTEERYEWGGYWRAPSTLLLNSGAGAGTVDQVFMGNFENDFTGWRYFRPCSDGEDQITPTEDSNGDAYAKFEYIPYTSTDNPLMAFYVLTAPTTVAEHDSQIVTISFPVTRYGYGRIYLGLYYVPNLTPSATPVFIEQSFRLLTENIAQPGLADLRKGGEISFTWVLRGIPNYPVDGSQWRIYPVLRTDDSEEYGAMEIRIGNAQPEDSQITGSRNGQLSMYGRPFPQTYNVYNISWTGGDIGVPPPAGGGGGK